jgi:hypothetical protein
LRGPLRPCEDDVDFCFLHAQEFRDSCDHDNQLRASLDKLNWQSKNMVSLSTLHCTILLILAVILHRLVKWVIGFFQSTDGLRVENDAICVWTRREREGITVQ